MCGIFGQIGTCNLPALADGVERLRHRGPDGHGARSDPDFPVFLGHRRLSIIDLTDRAAQPMSNEDGQLWIVFNGEIYNYRSLRSELAQLGHRFKSDSDTEVIIHAYEEWGEGCVRRFNGMFAFAIWDRNLKQVFLARDRIGIKPLYVYRDGRGVAFASEPRAFLGLPGFRKRANHAALARFLAFGYVVGEESIWDGVVRVPPATWLRIDVPSLRTLQSGYWTLPQPRNQQRYRDIERELEHLLSGVVADHLVADVPIGVLLSGGLDSSIVATFAAANHPGISAFTVGMTDWERDETSDARSIADHLRLCHFVHPIGKGDFHNPGECMGLIDDPISDTAVFSTNAVCRLAREKVKVALSGDGGDETFGGYSWYLQLEKHPIRRHALFLLERMRRRLGWGRPWPRGCQNRFDYFRLIMTPGFEATEVQRLFPQFGQRQFEAIVEATFNSSFNKADGRYRRWQELDFRTFLPDNNLVRIDQISMAHGLEVRVPLLDHRVVEFAFTLPEKELIYHEELKRPLRRIAKRKLPADLLVKRKQGFSCPVGLYLSEDDLCKALWDGALIESALVCPDSLRQLLAGPREGLWWNKVWLLASLNYWCRKWYLT